MGRQVLPGSKFKRTVSHRGFNRKHGVLMNSEHNNGLAANRDAYFIWLVLVITSAKLKEKRVSERLIFIMN